MGHAFQAKHAARVLKHDREKRPAPSRPFRSGRENAAISSYPLGNRLEGGCVVAVAATMHRAAGFTEDCRALTGNCDIHQESRLASNSFTKWIRVGVALTLSSH
ncbi:hypothetical protein [Bradyrhizobium sp. ARR65]|uniref:hypothetical protein n=1 Tax=Bradyrhizobium sp. ARR65 TaxID=1040989 RepID=UPI0012FA5917|nr:hypothetical protein [Bradyrhizobium sp. ARR65]